MEKTTQELMAEALASSPKPEVVQEPAPVEAPKPEEAKPATEEKAPAAPTEPEETVGAILADKKPEPKVVPEAAFLKEKSGRKEAEKALKDLQESIQEGATKAEVSADIASIAKEFDVDPTFLSKLAAVFKADATKNAKAEVESELAPLKEKERLEKIDNAFNKHYKSALERLPEYDGVANPAVIKAMSLMPENSEKTFSQLLEEVYGHTITGKKTIETAKPGGGKEPQGVDFERAKTDEKYFAEIMADPTMKAEYNSDLGRRLKL